MNQAIRVHDSDFIDHRESLHMLAWRAAYFYQGNWETMIEWRRYVTDGQVLSNKQARAVLNCVLGDATQQSLWPVILTTLDQVREQNAEAPPKLRLVRRDSDPNKKRPVGLRLRAVVHATYGKPNQKNGVVHIIDHSKTFMEWSVPRVPYEPWHDYDAQRIPSLHVVWKCANYRPNTPIVLYREPPEGIKRCRKCQEAS